MSVLFSERVVETTTTSGTGDYSLGGAPSGARTFVDAFGDGGAAPYRVQNSDNTVWEERYGVVTDGSPDTLSRGTFLRSSTGSTINWPDSSTKYVYNLPQASVLDGLTHTNRGAARPAWLPNGGRWIHSDSDTLYWYDGTGDREMGAIVSDEFVPYSNGLPLPYAMGSWTPALTFATPGNLSVAYSTQFGRYLRLGSLVLATFMVATSGFTHTSASGAASITGLPLAGRTLANARWYGPLTVTGVTKASYTDFTCRVSSGESSVGLTASGSGQTQTTVNAADMPTGGSVVLLGTVTYETDAA